MEHLYAEGAAYRKAVEGRPKFVVLLGVWLIFFPCLVVCLCLMLAIVVGLGSGVAGLIFFWLLCALGVICAVMLYRVTKNYISLPKQGNEQPEQRLS
jgi:hypothetical protein